MRPFLYVSLCLAWTAAYADERPPRELDPRPALVQPKPRITPTADYEVQILHGFKVLIHPEVLLHQKESAEALAELTKQLEDIVRAVPASRLNLIRDVRIWLEWEQKKNGAAEFHVSPSWLFQNGYNPDKVRDVEICNARNFVAWSRLEQPSMLLHELAHAYHHRVLGVDHPGVRAVYQQAMKRKLYDLVAHARVGNLKAYAVTNHEEYFAEITEAYFGKNDYFPFTRAELERHDPDGYQLMVEVWGIGRQLWRDETPTRRD